MLSFSPVTSWHKSEKYPQISPRAFVHPTAVLIGDIRVADDVVIYPGVVLRADEGSPIIIGRGTNVQDGVIMHCLKDSSIVIGENCSIAHGAVIHGPCQLGDNCFVGFNAVLLKATLGSGCFVSHCALVTGVEIGNDRLVGPAQVVDSAEKASNLPPTAESQVHFAQEVLQVNEELRQGYQAMAQLEGKWDLSNLPAPSSEEDPVG
ncbi:hypothetical protein [Desulfurispora thermophila]|uniref:hypothetical protein n=1 Tax=Desulfurispora thermophila TaxID=265470 RepID=UPI000382EDF5|nr:hypothetical protein [Desulfurispora thermophila]